MDFGEGGARLLSFVLPKARSLRELRLSGTGLGDAGAKYVATALRAMTTVRFADLRRNSIGPAVRAPGSKWAPALLRHRC